MAATNKVNDKEASSEGSELDTLRNIVFGEAKTQLEQRIDGLEKRNQASFDKLEHLLEKNLTALQQKMAEEFQSLENKLAYADQSQDKKAEELNAYADRISSALEMAEANSKQENDELHDRLDRELKSLSDNFTLQLTQAIDKLNQVSSELNSSKTDRRTLAKLLASVASNLETGEDE
jgi:exonuclease VII large subunit